MTELQEEIQKRYLSGEKPSAIAKTLNCKKRYVNAVIKKAGLRTVPTQFPLGTPVPKVGTLHGKYRLHGSYFVIHIISKGTRFKNLQDTQGTIDSHPFKICQNDTIQLRQATGEQYPASIYADDIKDLNNIASRYWAYIIGRLERRLDCLLIKDGVPTYHEAQSHIAYVDSGIAKEVILEQGKGLYFYTRDGRPFLYFDMSHGRVEHEHIGSKGLSWETGEKVEPYFQDLYHSEWYKASEVREILNDMVNVIRKEIVPTIQETARQTSFVAANASTHFPLLIDMKKSMEALNRKVKDKTIQKGLGGWL